MMMAPLADIDWADPSVAIPAFLTLVAIPLTFSIANGLAFGVIAYVGIRALTGRLKRGDWLLAVLAVDRLLKFEA